MFFPARFPAFISLSVSERDAVTQPLISEQQRAGGDRFAKTNNLISSGAALISSAQNSLEKLESQNISTGMIIKGLYVGMRLKGAETQRDLSQQVTHLCVSR